MARLSQTGVLAEQAAFVFGTDADEALDGRDHERPL
jgi:hypothetical protein